MSTCAPLSGVFPGDYWPAGVVAADTGVGRPTLTDVEVWQRLDQLAPLVVAVPVGDEDLLRVLAEGIESCRAVWGEPTRATAALLGSMIRFYGDILEVAPERLRARSSAIGVEWPSRVVYDRLDARRWSFRSFLREYAP